MMDEQLYNNLLVQDVWVNGLTLARLSPFMYRQVLKDIDEQLKEEGLLK